MRKSKWAVYFLLLLATLVSAQPSGQPAEKKAPENMVLVPAGQFWMGCDSPRDTGCNGDEKPFHNVYLDAFSIDKYEVTVDQYAACVKTKKCSIPGERRLCNWGEPNKGNHPINCVDWNQAKTYCESAGKRLPTEAEWEKAARGTDKRLFPWGNQPASCKYAVMDDGGNGCGRKSSWPIGSKPEGVSPYGAMDMAGNVQEWVADWYGSLYYIHTPDRNPKGPNSADAGRRAVRGGGWIFQEQAQRTSEREGVAPETQDLLLGFRCAQ